MRKKIWLIALILCLGTTGFSYGAQSVSEDVLMDLLNKASNHANKEQIIEELRDSFSSPQNIDILKSVIDLGLSASEKEALSSRGISQSDLYKSLDDLKSWDAAARMQLLDYVDNNQMNKAKDLILNNGKSPEEEKPASSGGGGANPGTTPVPAAEIGVPAQVEIPVEETVEKNDPIAFKDINNHWAKASIEKMVALGIVKGMTEDRFEPQLSVTRSQMITLIVRLLEIDAAENMELPFEDIHKDSWDYDFVKAAYQANLVSGTSAKAFEPNQPISREQMMVMVINGLKYKHMEAANSKSDLAIYQDHGQIADWAAESMEQAVGLGLIRGKGENILDPKGIATRAEAVTILEKVYILLQNQQTLVESEGI